MAASWRALKSLNLPLLPRGGARRPRGRCWRPAHTRGRLRYRSWFRRLQQDKGQRKAGFTQEAPRTMVLDNMTRSVGLGEDLIL